MDWDSLSKFISEELKFDIKLEEDDEVGAIFSLKALDDGVFVHFIEATEQYVEETGEIHSAVYYVKERRDKTNISDQVFSQLFTAYYNPKTNKWTLFTKKENPKIDFFSTYRKEFKG